MRHLSHDQRNATVPAMIVLRWIGRILRGLCLGLGGIVLVLILAAVVTAWYFKPGGTTIAAGSMLHLELDHAIVEAPGAGPLGQLLAGRQLTLRDVVTALERAKTDNRIDGVVADLSRTTLPFAQLQELRDAVMSFRESGKQTHAFADGYDNRGYYLASAFADIWLQPSGDFSVIGLAAEVPFARDLLDRLGVEPRMVRLEEYKGAMDSLIEREMSPAYRESTKSLLDSLSRQLIDGIATGRSLDAAAVAGLIDKAPLHAGQAHAAGLVDHPAYWSELRQSLGATTALIKPKAYVAATEKDTDADHKFAVIYAIGQIVTGGSDLSPFSGELVVDAKRISAAIRAADRDDTVQAILLRIDSPGGSYVGSDRIWYAIGQAKKPVIASMGRAAASGGYFIAAATDHIVANPGTLTGSIGVIGGKMVLTKLWDNIDVNWERITTAENAAIYSANKDFTPEQWRQFRDQLRHAYDDFVGKVAAGRAIDRSAALALAKGRVWTGSQAKEKGLVDRLGGFREAVEAARSLAGIEVSAEVDLVVYPQADPLDWLDSVLQGTATKGTWLQTLAWLGILPDDLVPAAKALAGQTVSGDPIQLLAPPIRIR